MEHNKNKFEDSSSSSSSSSTSGENRWKSQGRAATAAALDEGSHVFENVKDQGTQVVDRVKEMATNLKDKATEYGEMAIDNTSSLIRRYPAQSLLVGFGAGLAIGLLVARR